MNQASVIAILLSVVVFSSCSRRVYQVSEFAYAGEHAGEASNVTEYEGVVITYDFVSEGSPLGFTVHNQLDHPIVIDFTLSSIIVGERSIPYIRQTVNATFTGLTNEVSPWEDFSGTGTVEVDLERALIVPGTKMSFQRYANEWPEKGTIYPRSGEVLTLKVEEPWSFRHHLCYRIEDGSPENIFIDDEFVLVSSRLMGANAFLQNKHSIVGKGPLTGYRMEYTPPKVKELNVALSLSAVLALVVVAAVEASGE